MQEASFTVEQWPIDRVVPYDRNPRKNDEAVKEVAKSLSEFGWQQPLVVDPDGVLIVGHTRLKAAKRLGLEMVPVKIARGLSDAQVKAYRIADNRTGEFADWDDELLKLEITELKMIEPRFDEHFLSFDDLFEEKETKNKKEEKWDLSDVQDDFVITVRGPLTRQAEIMDVLKPVSDGLEIEASQIQRNKKKKK